MIAKPGSTKASDRKEIMFPAEVSRERVAEKFNSSGPIVKKYLNPSGATKAKQRLNQTAMVSNFLSASGITGPILANKQSDFKSQSIVSPASPKQLKRKNSN